MGHNDIRTRDGQSLQSFVIDTGSFNAYPYVTPESHVYINYSCEQKKLLGRLLVTQKVETPPLSIFLGHGFVQPVVSEGHPSHCVWYHSYQSSVNHKLLEATDFPNGGSIHGRSRADVLLVKYLDGS